MIICRVSQFGSAHSQSAPTSRDVARRLCTSAIGMALYLASTHSLASQSDMTAQFNALRGQLEASHFKHPMLLQSSDTSSGIKGDVFAIVDHPIQTIGAALNDPSRWCEAMLLHVNNRACTVSKNADVDVITLSLVRKYDQPVAAAFHIPFDFRVTDATAQHLEISLYSKSGPLGTSNYRIAIEGVPISPQRSFLHFSYAYDESFLARTGTAAYLSIFSRGKVGFTVTGQTSDGKPSYIKGTRGLVERNAMRYFLAIDTYLSSAPDAPSRWNNWFAATEQYSQQLHELDLASYLAVKAEDSRR